jgi:hypothetical protein
VDRKAIREGTVFAVPLKPVGFGLCVVTRHARSAVTVGCFFGPATCDPPLLPSALDPGETALVARFGDIPMVEEIWPLLGELASWDRSLWPSDRFSRVDPSGRVFVEDYDVKNPNKLVASRSVAADEAIGIPDGAAMGYLIVRSKLSALLRH